jgi:hypothetical protein
MLGGPPIAACSGGRDSVSDWDGSVQDSAGVEIVLNHGTPLWDEDDRWGLSEALRFGVADGEPNYMFGQISGLGILSDGSIVVADGMAQNVRLFDAGGRWQKTLGQPGSGPGEFGNFGLTVLVGPGDTLLVEDPRNWRANRFAPDGSWLSSWPSFRPESGWLVTAWDYSSSGRIVSHMSRIAEMRSEESDTLDFVVRRDLRGATMDTLASVRARSVTRVSDGRMEFSLFAGEATSSLCADDDLLAGVRDRYEIRRFEVGGLTQIVRLDREAAPVTESDRTIVRQWYRRSWLEEAGFTPARVEELLSAFRFNETYPFFRTLRCGPHGSIWLQPWTPVGSLTEEQLGEVWGGADGDTSADFDVFDRRGRYLGVVPLPEGFLPNRFQGDYLYGRWRDSLDVEYVMVMKVEGLGPDQGR